MVAYMDTFPLDEPPTPNEWVWLRMDVGIPALKRFWSDPDAKKFQDLLEKQGCATRNIYNIGNPKNNISVKELAETMVDLALQYPEYRDAAKKVRIVKTTADRYYGRGYQDVQNRVPKIDNTQRELGWRPRTGMKDALRHIYDAYRSHVAEAKHLVK